MLKVYIQLVIATLLLYSCFPFGTQEDDAIVSNSIYEPIIMSRTDFNQSVTYTTPRSIINSGKIYIKDHYLFINELNEGFHVFNNANPEAPVNIGFINIPATTDIAIKEDILYCNSATDLLAIQPNFSSNTIEVTKRIENVFPNELRISPDGFYYSELLANQVIIGWQLKE